MTSTFSIVTNKSRSFDNFTANFRLLPENVAGALNKQLLRVTRPEIAFEATPKRQKSFTYVDKGSVSFSTMQLIFADDDEGVVSSLINGQVMRQLGKTPDIYGGKDDHEERRYRFDVEVQLLNARTEPTEKYVAKSAFITGVSYDTLNVQDQTDTSVITVTIAFDGLDIDLAPQVADLINIDADSDVMSRPKN